MNRFFLLAFSIGFICFALAYDWYTHYFWLTPVDRKLVTEEDRAVTVQLGIKGIDDKDYQIEIAKPPENGSLTYQASRYVYLPLQDFNGTDQFEYRIKKGNKSGTTATVEIEIVPKNDQPKANDLKIKIKEDSPVKIQVTGNDLDSDPLEFSLINQPQHGSISGESPQLIYTPANDFNGIDSFAYIARDATSYSLPATVTIEILPVNDAPSASGQIITAFENTPINIRLEGTDVDSQINGYRLVELPKNGVLELKRGNYRYTPHRTYIGTDRIMFTVRDELQESAPAVIEVDIKKITRDVELSGVLKHVIKDGGVAIGDFYKPEYVFHSGKYIPASVLKIVTATAALNNLGADYRFKTEFYIDGEKNLYIKGFGDPTLTSKDWHDIAKELQAKRIFEHDLTALIIDVSAFAVSLQVDGRKESLHYFDSPPSALASNCNTVAVRIQNNRRIQVVDEYTPLTSLMVKKAKWLPAGYQNFNIAMDSDESIRYSSELVIEIFKQYGAVFTEKFALGKIPNQLEPIYVFKSKSDLKTVIKEMLQDSNNFIANQLLLVLAYEKRGEGVDISDGAEIVTRFLENKIGIQPDDINLVEGSGLSTRNSIDLLAMLKVINYFNEYRELLPQLKYSRDSELAKAGRKWNILAKSGTLNNISTLAGFIQMDDKEWKPFVIMLNNTRKERGTVIDIIGQYYHS